MHSIEALARAWIECDPNRGGTDPDKPIEGSGSGYSGEDGEFVTVSEDTPLTGKPNWHWFIPRAEATLNFLSEHGFEVQRKSE